MRRKTSATRVAALGVATAVALSMLAAVNPAATASPSPSGGRGLESAPPGDEHHGLPDVDRRGKATAPSATQRRAAERSTDDGRASGARGVTWNRFGAPATYVLDGNRPVATGLAKDPEQAARQFLAAERAAFGLSAAEVEALELVGTNPIGDATVVLLRQTFGGVPAGLDGMVTVAVEGAACVMSARR